MPVSIYYSAVSAALSASWSERTDMPLPARYRPPQPPAPDRSSFPARIPSVSGLPVAAHNLSLHQTDSWLRPGPARRYAAPDPPYISSRRTYYALSTITAWRHDSTRRRGGGVRWMTGRGRAHRGLRQPGAGRADDRFRSARVIQTDSGLDW